MVLNLSVIDDNQASIEKVTDQADASRSRRFDRRAFWSCDVRTRMRFSGLIVKKATFAEGTGNWAFDRQDHVN